MHPLKRIQLAWNKFLFCFRITSGWSSFIHLIINTKKYRRRKYTPTVQSSEVRLYNVRFNTVDSPIYLRTYSGDLNVFYEVFWEKIYSHKNLSWPTTSIVVDLGAHIGLSSLFFLLQHPKTLVYSVEADKENFDILKKNLGTRHLQKRSIAINAAISKSNGKAYLKKQDQSYNNSVSSHPTAIQIVAIDMPTLIKDNNIPSIDLLKIDIEGWEVMIFQGDVTWLNKVRLIVLECHSTEIRQNCETILTTNGFDILPSETNNQYLDLLWARKRETT